ncbi:MAG: HAD-IA family hydrolase [Actinomycetota bacterium]|nr:HAD-IA family hydrolase [Actinomycetota bacterium]
MIEQMAETRGGQADRYEAVLFDLLSALVDSWSLWDAVAGDPPTGRRWRNRYLQLTYATGDYVPYESVVAQAARAEGLDDELAFRLTARWDELQPWPEAPSVLEHLSGAVRVGVVTNCSNELGHRAAARLGVGLDVVATAEDAGAYKPRPQPYLHALQCLDLPPERVLFVAGSRFDLPGAASVGLPVWWHNRLHLDRGALPAPIAEYDTLTPLLDYVLADRDR